MRLGTVLLEHIVTHIRSAMYGEDPLYCHLLFCKAAETVRKPKLLGRITNLDMINFLVRTVDKFRRLSVHNGTVEKNEGQPIQEVKHQLLRRRGIFIRMIDVNFRG